MRIGFQYRVMGETGEGLTFNMITTLHLTPLMPWRRCCTRAATTIQTDKKTTDQIYYLMFVLPTKKLPRRGRNGKNLMLFIFLGLAFHWVSEVLLQLICWLLAAAGAVLSQSALLLPLARGWAEHARCRSQLLIASICSNTNNFIGSPFSTANAILRLILWFHK